MHPLGKSPVITITPAGADAKPIVLAESGWMTEYLCTHYPEGQRLVPKRWQEGKENTIGGETEAYMRYKYYLHYAEGTLMPYLVLSLVIGRMCHFTLCVDDAPDMRAQRFLLSNAQASRAATFRSLSDPSPPLSPTGSSPCSLPPISKRISPCSTTNSQPRVASISATIS